MIAAADIDILFAAASLRIANRGQPFSDAIEGIFKALEALKLLPDSTFTSDSPILHTEPSTKDSVIISTSVGKLEITKSWARLSDRNGYHELIYSAATSKGSLATDVIDAMYQKACDLRQVPPVEHGDLLRVMNLWPRPS